MPLHDVSPGSLSDIRCKVHNSTSFSLVSDTNNHAVTFDTNDFDPRGMHSTVTNTSRITFPIAGRWWLFADVLSSVVASSSGFLMGFRVNGGATWIGLDSV